MNDRAILIVNMGGPSSQDEIRGYLLEIFRDPLILPVPGLFRPLVASMIVRKRLEAVKERYQLIGGSSPLLKWTAALAQAMEIISAGTPVRFAFRYSPPMIGKALDSLAQDGFRRVTILPLFPHYTVPMSGSVEIEARKAAKKLGIELSLVPAFWQNAALISIQQEYLRSAVEAAGAGARVLFIAHGIPQRNVDRGEDYPDQVRANAAEVAKVLPERVPWNVAFQSRVGPVKWTEPYLENELERTAVSNHPVVLMPLSFVADCLETLYDLDIVATEFLRSKGIREIRRVRVYNDDADFARVMAELALGVGD